MTTEPTVPGSIPLFTLTLPDGTRRTLDESSLQALARGGFEPGSVLVLPDGRKYKRGADGSWTEAGSNVVMKLQAESPRPPNRRERRANMAIQRKKK
jgi:hypothetical protein